VIDFWSEEQEQEFESTAADSSDQAATSGWRKEQGGGKCSRLVKGRIGAGADSGLAGKGESGRGEGKGKAESVG
jgi:hypothetical protein